MLAFGGTSVRSKLILASILSSGTALLVVGAVITSRDLSQLRQALVRRMSVQAEIVGTNCLSALLFNDPRSAEATLGALRADPRVMSGVLYDSDGTVFATYARHPSIQAPALDAGFGDGVEEYRLNGNHLVLAKQVSFEGRKAGTVVVASDLSEIDDAILRNVFIVGSVLVISLTIALVIASWLQRDISQPIRHLAETARRISQDKDYSVRAVGERADEIGSLVTAFNEMLEEIRHQEAALRTAHDRLEQRVVQRTAQLQAANDELEAFSYSVSHDLRAPLRHISGFAEILKEDAEGLGEAGRRYLDKISQSATRMGQLIDDLLVFCRMGRSELQSASVDLSKLVEQVVEEAEPDAKRSIDWHVGDLPTVRGDEAMLRVVLVNLVSNAIKYTGKTPQPRIEIQAIEDGPAEVIVCVRDNGVGFEMEYASKLFGVFQRLHRSDEFEGTGIGLANVRRIVHRHEGRTWAEGDPGHGAAFYFSLPRDREALE